MKKYRYFRVEIKSRLLNPETGYTEYDYPKEGRPICYAPDLSAVIKQFSENVQSSFKDHPQVTELSREEADVLGKSWRPKRLVVRDEKKMFKHLKEKGHEKGKPLKDIDGVEEVEGFRIEDWEK